MLTYYISRLNIRAARPAYETEIIHLFCYFSAPVQQGCNLYVNGDPRDEYFSDFRWAIVNCGNFEPGDTVTVTLELKDEDLRIYDAYFYMEDTDRLAAWYQNAGADAVNLEQISARKYTGTIDATEEESVIFTVPYEKGWTIRVDGKHVEAEKKWGALLSFTVPSGTHTFEAVYFPQGMKAGILLSSLAALILVILALKQRKNA